MRHAWQRLCIGVGLAATRGCLPVPTVPCGDVVCPPGLACAGDGRCAAADQVAACTGAADGASCATSQFDDGFCAGGICTSRRCGDGQRNPPEQCEGTDLGGVTCEALGYYQGALACGDSCLYDVSGCAERCGDDQVNGAELCDGALAPTSCLDYGFSAGLVACGPSCGLAFEDCVAGGWQRIWPAFAESAGLSEDNTVLFAISDGVYRLSPGGSPESVDPSPVYLQRPHRDGLVIGSKFSGDPGVLIFAPDGTVAASPFLLSPDVLPLQAGFVITQSDGITFTVSTYDALGTLVSTGPRPAPAANRGLLADGDRGWLLDGETLHGLTDDALIWGQISNNVQPLAMRPDGRIVVTRPDFERVLVGWLRPEDNGTPALVFDLGSNQAGLALIGDHVDGVTVASADGVTRLFDDGRMVRVARPTDEGRIPTAATRTRVLASGPDLTILRDGHWTSHLIGATVEAPTLRIAGNPSGALFGSNSTAVRDLAATPPVRWRTGGLNNLCALTSGMAGWSNTGLQRCTAPETCEPAPNVADLLGANYTVTQVACTGDTVWAVVAPFVCKPPTCRANLAPPQLMSWTGNAATIGAPLDGVRLTHLDANASHVVALGSVIADGLSTVFVGTSPSDLVPVHTRSAGALPFRDVRACADGSWLAISNRDVIRGNSSSATAEVMPGFDRYTTFAGTGCDDVWLIGEVAAYQRTPAGWRPIQLDASFANLTASTVSAAVAGGVPWVLVDGAWLARPTPAFSAASAATP